MVVIHVKRSDGDAFLFETTTDTKNDELIESLVQLQNLRLRSKVIVDSVRGLAQYGMMKDPKNSPVGPRAVSSVSSSSSSSSSFGNKTDPENTFVRDEEVRMDCI
jgi:hypothetical protein